MLLLEILTDNIYQYLGQLPKHYISAEFLLIEGALRKPLLVAPLAESFKTITLGKLH